MRYRYTGSTQSMQVRVADDQHMPTGVDVLCGTETQQGTGAKFDSMNESVTCVVSPHSSVECPKVLRCFV